MSRPNDEDEYEQNGVFWPAENPEWRAPGRLYKRNGKIRIQLLGTVTSMLKTVSEGSHWVAKELIDEDEFSNPITLHGDLGVRHGRVTALDCLIVRWSTNLFSDDGEECTLRPRRVLHGSHESADSEDYVGVEVRLRNLDFWANSPAITISREEDKSTRVVHAPRSTQRARMDSGATVEIVDKVYSSQSITEGRIFREAWMRVDSIKETSLDDILWGFLGPLSSLIELSLGASCDPIEVRVHISGRGWFSLVMESLVDEKAEDEFPDQLANFSDFGIEKIAAWLDKSSKLGPTPAVVGRLGFDNESIHLETHLLELTTIAEGIHSILYPESRSIPDKEMERIRGLIKDLLQDELPSYANVINGSLRHVGSLGYAKKLMQLIESTGKESPKYVGDYKKWARAIEEIRNGYAHRTISLKDSDEIERHVVALRSLQWLLRSILLLEAGMESGLVAQRITKLSIYQYFLNDAKSAFPKIYGATPRE